MTNERRLIRTPVFFIGHGNPMNAVADNAFTRSLKAMRDLCPRPRAILCVSAHWMTEGTWITHMPKPKTIHDFHGFPQALFEIQYPAPGSPEVAELVRDTVKGLQVNLDDEMWGLDYGTWSVLRHVFPEATIPVLQLSLHMEKPAEYHYELGTQLRALREKNILIVGSGNVVHNLRRILWNPDAQAYRWAIEFDAWVKANLESGNFVALIKNFLDTEAGRASVPTAEHYYPFLYALGAAVEDDRLHFEHEGVENGSISMRTFSYRAR